MTVGTVSLTGRRGDRGLPTLERRSAGGYGFGHLLRSELTKLRTVRSTARTLALTVVLGIGLSAVAAAETRSHWATMSPADRLAFDPTRLSLIGMFFGQLTLGVLAILVVSAEYGTGTIRATLAAAPRRWSVLAAKVVVFAAVALVVAEAAAFAAFFVGQALLTAPATHTTIGSAGALRAVAGSGVSLTVLGLLALGLATIIRHTAGAISAYIGILFVLPLVTQALPTSLGNEIERMLPAGIGSSIVSLHTPPHSFAPWPSFLLLCGYAVVVLVVGCAVLVRRDA